jgi:hypothetical protein
MYAGSCKGGSVCRLEFREGSEVRRFLWRHWVEREVAVVSRCVWFALSKGRLPRRQSVVVGRGDGQQRSQSAQSPKRPYRLHEFEQSMLCLKTNDNSFRHSVPRSEHKPFVKYYY